MPPVWTGLATAPQNEPVSYYFGKDIVPPTVRIAGTAPVAPLAGPMIPATAPFSPAGVPTTMDTKIYNIATPFDVNFRWGVEAIDDRAGFHVNVTTPATIEAGPVLQTIDRYDGWSGAPEPDQAVGVAGVRDYLNITLGDNYGRTSTVARCRCRVGIPRWAG